MYAVAPAVGHAPSAASFTMSRMQETYVRLAVLHEVLEANLEAVGGARGGRVYPDERRGDLGANAEEIMANYNKYPFLKEEFPFDPAFYADLRVLADSLSSTTPAATSAPGRSRARDHDHRKTQFFGTREALDRIARNPAMVGFLKAWIAQLSVPFTDSIINLPVQDRPELKAFRDVAAVVDTLPPEVKARDVTYLTVGSMNKDYRSAVLDGETVFVLSGDWSLIGWPDFFAEWGYVTWVTGPAELEQYLPPYTKTQRWVGRRLRRIL